MSNQTPSKNIAEVRRLLAALGTRVSAYYREKYPLATADNLAADLGVSQRPGYDLANGRPPAIKHLVRMVALEGMRFVQHVIHPIASREADAQHITVREYLARQRAENERQRILASEAAALAGQPRSRVDRVVRAAGATVRLIGKLSLRRKQEAA